MLHFHLRSRLVSCNELSSTVLSTEIATGQGLAARAPDNAAALPTSFSSSLPRRARPKRAVCNMAALYNDGNTCFLNTTIQLLRATPNFTFDLKSLASTVRSAMLKQQQHTGNAAACDEVCSAIPVAWRIALELNNVYDEMGNREVAWLNSSQEVPIKPVSLSCLLDLLRDVDPLFQSNEQQDVHELWLRILEYIQDAWTLVNQADRASLTPAVRSVNNANIIQSSTPDTTAFQRVPSGIHCPNKSPSQAASDTVSSADSPPRLYHFADILVSAHMQPPLLTPTNTVISADWPPQSPAALDVVTSTDVAPQLLAVSDTIASTCKPSPLPAASVAVALADLSPSPATRDPVRSAHLSCKRSFGDNRCHFQRFNRASPVSALEGHCVHQSCNAATIATFLSQNRAGMRGLLCHSIRSEVQSYLSNRHVHAMHTGLSLEVADNPKDSATLLNAAVTFPESSSEKKIKMSKNPAVKDSVEVLEHNSLDGCNRSRPSFRQSTITSFFPIKNSTMESTESALESCAQSSSLLHHCLSDDISSQEQRPCDFDEPADMDVDTPSSETVNVSQVFRTVDVVDRIFKGELSVSTRCAECESSKSRSEVFTEVGVAVADAVRCIKCDRINIQKAEEIARSKRRRKTGKGSNHRALPPPIASPPEEQEDVNHFDNSSCSGDFSCVILKAFFDVASFRGTNKYLCENCARRTEADRRTHYTKLPPVLTVQLRCFTSVCRNDCVSYSKISDHLSAPMTLPCLSCFESGNVDCTDDSHSRYFLYGVVVHIGQFVNKGHYVCYVKVATKSSDSSSATNGGISSASSKQADVPSSGDVGGTSASSSETIWVLLDDAQAVVCPRSASSLDELLEATGNGLRATPYLLFYCRASASHCKSVNDSMQPNLYSTVADSLYAVDGRLLRPEPSEK